MSLIVHPAPLITKEPINIILRILKSGKLPGAVANATDHPQGQNNNHVPKK